MFFGALDEISGYNLWVFVARIVLGYYHDIRMFCEDGAADEASGWVTTTSAAMNGNNSAFMPLNRIKDFLQGIWSMGVVYYNRKGLAFFYNTHTTLNIL